MSSPRGPNGALSDLELLEWAVPGSGWMLGCLGVVGKRGGAEGG
jgi:hypothetical protein